MDVFYFYFAAPVNPHIPIDLTALENGFKFKRHVSKIESDRRERLTKSRYVFCIGYDQR